MKKPVITAVAAIGRNREIGKKDKLLWHIPDDLKRFSHLTGGNLTMGHPVIMGRKTFESIVGYLGKPLPNRTNIVVTHDKDWEYKWPVEYSDTVGQLGFGPLLHANSIEEAIEKAKASKKVSDRIFVIGGAQIYKAALPYIDKLQLTIIDDEKEADTFFPPYEHIFTKKVFEESREWNGIKYKWIDLER